MTQQEFLDWFLPFADSQPVSAWFLVVAPGSWFTAEGKLYQNAIADDRFPRPVFFNTYYGSFAGLYQAMIETLSKLYKIIVVLPVEDERLNAYIELVVDAGIYELYVAPHDA